MRATSGAPNRPGVMFSGRAVFGTQSITSSTGNRNSGGITPTITRFPNDVYTDRPRTSGSLPNHVVHSAWLITMTCPSSSSVARRPMAGVAPSVLHSALEHGAVLLWAYAPTADRQAAGRAAMAAAGGKDVEVVRRRKPVENDDD